ncbi:hypothetical protein BSK59_15535 [Paenibacillus odorifer]|uniref:hypothetical protein n=1 Tax=Paenibacillus odorifer TaxID=189426 RepID=UPI00096F6FAC|nr:hypothetical protein [Paenibacillus odorifer]OME53991.1 hypothetical protein BSK59_15535 [Paenibacillus odorifer]
MATRKTCKGECQKSKLLNDFYASNSIMFDGHVPVCKKCLKEMIDENDIESVKTTLQRIDKPFIAKVWKSAEENDSDTVGTYFRMINSLQQYKASSWADSDMEGENQTSIYKHKFDDIESMDEIATDEGVLRLTKDIAMKFGSGYTNREYLTMEKFYIDMDNTHAINTPQLKVQLVYLCKLQIWMNRALEQGNDSSFKNYNDRYEKILQSSGFRPIDKKSSSEASGLRSFGVVFEEVEKLGYREPKAIEERMDLVDMAILVHANYVRQLLGHDRMLELPEEMSKQLQSANGTLASDRGEV